MDVPRARRVERPGWLNTRVLLGLFLFVGSVLAGQRIIEASKDTVPIWAASRDLASGTVLTPSDLQLVDVRLAGGVDVVYALGSTEIEGAVVTRPVAAGELLPLGSISGSGTLIDGRIITIPVTPEHAVGGALSPGDLIDVFATFNSREVGARTIQLLSGAEVVEVVAVDGLVSGSTPTAISVRIAGADAGRVAFALRNADIDVLLVQGEIGDSLLPAVSAEDVKG